MPDAFFNPGGWISNGLRRGSVTVTAGKIYGQDPYAFSARMIARHELRVWFEPDWALARRLARRYPWCTICSIPYESNTPSLHKVPGWRPKRSTGQV